MAANMKTPVTILTELMTKLNSQVDFEIIHQEGPPHNMVFKYQCTAAGVSVIATGRSKKESKQEAAQMCLDRLADLGKYRPAPTSYAGFPPTPKRSIPTPADEEGSNVNSYVALLREFTEEYHLPGPVYELMSDSGPPHCRQFNIQVTVGGHVRSANGSTKKVARQIAAQQLYLYLKENLKKVTSDFNETTALCRANLKAQERYLELQEETPIWRPNLGSKLSETHLVLIHNIDEELRKGVLEFIRNSPPLDAVTKAELMLRKLGMEFEWFTLPSSEHNHVVSILNVPRAMFSFTIGSPANTEDIAKETTAIEAIKYVETMLA